MTLTQEMRRLVGAGTAEYTIAGSAYWTDTQLSDELTRQSMLYVRPLIWEQDFDSGGKAYTQAVVPGATHALFCEAGTAGTAGTVVNEGGSSVTGWNVDRNGRITFDVDQGPVTLYSRIPVVDLYGAAANVLDDWATHLKSSFDFSADGALYRRGMEVAQIKERSDRLRARRGPGVGC